VVDAKKCNACHDALGTTFHNASYGGNNVVACRTCHVTSSGGSLLEMQSRGIDSYIHAIHKFQKLGAGFLDFSDPVVAARYDQHVEHLFPNFTIKNCESCHNAGTYEVPDQSKSLPGLESPSWTNDTWDRSIGNVPSYVVGPANRACGGCHRAVLINEDDAGGLLAFNTHTDMGGYTLETGETEDGVDFVYAMIERIMSLFE
jgi:OmcA/MtrC family decaheme c-type cytochrome